MPAATQLQRHPFGVTYNIVSHTHTHTQVYALLVVALFLATELYPLLVALDDELLLAMSGEDAAAGNGSGGGGRQRERSG